MTPFIGQIVLFAGDFAPRGWALCDGQLLSIASHAALFGVLGTTYAGDGRVTFALPDLRGRIPVHAGADAGRGLAPRTLGQQGGAEQVTLTVREMPLHDHPVLCASGRGTSKAPVGCVPAGDPDSCYSVSGNDRMSAIMIGGVGGGQAHEDMPPFTGLNDTIALEGTFPPRP